MIFENNKVYCVKKNGDIDSSNITTAMIETTRARFEHEMYEFRFLRKRGMFCGEIFYPIY